MGRGASTFGLSALPISLLAIAVAYLYLWRSDRYQGDRQLLRETAIEPPRPLAP